ncbi:MULTISPECIES: hypothetical protein [Nocardia]|uniref:Uncharacterized protein n=1 Tax=Nocardia vinacea TaxID=96468 RepID=A0ABZ1YLG7_9NOCA|nr:hypothetical protein [Nocardia vinacea]
MRYRLSVVAPSAVEVVRYAGGWLFDRVMAGWDVTVLVADHTDVRPLQILGATVLDLERSLASPRSPIPHTVAVAVDLYESDERVRRGVLDILDCDQSEVALLGEVCPSELSRRIGSVQHRLSRAARTFKAQALAAAAVSVESVESVEVLHSRSLSTPRPPTADLVLA